ncbi:MAG: GTP-binding protein, partial [bacterium]|nr:GTP-binding protein [bacterium]
MKTYPTERIRNVALVGASSAGKTMLAEAMLFRAGALDRMGGIESQNTVCDHEPEERDAGSSQVMALASFEWNDHKINLLDTPGSFDFAGEQWAAMAVADLLVMVVDATAGVDHAVAGAWRRAAEAGIPRLFFVNKLDREFVDFDAVLSELQETFDSGVAPLELPIAEGPRFCGVADLLSDDAWLYEGGSITETPIPTDMAARVEEVRESLIEGIVVADDDLLERYLEGDVPT